MKKRILLLSAFILQAAFGSPRPNVPIPGSQGFGPHGPFGGKKELHFEYDVLAWLVGDRDTTRFRSFIQMDTRTETRGASFVVIDEAIHSEDSRRRYTLDFDSLKARRVPSIRQKMGIDSLEYADTAWVKAVRRGKEWMFPLFPGRAGLYGSEPAGDYVYMDTGSGLVKYSEKEYRKYLGRDSAAATVLKRAPFFHRKVYLRAIEAYDRGGTPRP